MCKGRIQHIEPEIGTSIRERYLLGQRSVLACEGADAVMLLVHYNNNTLHL